MTRTAGIELVYACGCRASAVGQFFDRGQLVCPEHREPAAPTRRPAQPWRGQVRLHLRLQAESRDLATAFAGELSDHACQDERVRAAVVSVVDDLGPSS